MIGSALEHDWRVKHQLLCWLHAFATDAGGNRPDLVNFSRFLD